MFNKFLTTNDKFVHLAIHIFQPAVSYQDVKQGKAFFSL